MKKPQDFEPTVMSQPFQNVPEATVRAKKINQKNQNQKKAAIFGLMTCIFLGVSVFVAYKWWSERHGDEKPIQTLSQHLRSPMKTAVLTPSPVHAQTLEMTNLPALPSTPASSIDKNLEVMLKSSEQAVQGIRALSHEQKMQGVLLSKIEQDVAKLGSDLSQWQTKAVQSDERNAKPKTVTARRQARHFKAAFKGRSSQSEVNILSIDMWDGKPSMVMGSKDGTARGVRFLSEGDSKNGVTLKRADPQAQRSVFDVRGKEVVVVREAQE
jgi:hypothetical protein